MHYPDIDSLPDPLKAIVAEKRGANVFKMLMHAPNMAPSITAVVDALAASTNWPAPWRELAIIRVGHRYEAAYEVHLHEQIGRLAGLSAVQLSACALGADQSALSGEEQMILRLTDALLQNHSLSPAERDEALACMSLNGLMDFVLTVGYYQLVCNFLNVFEVGIEDQPLLG